MNPQSGKEKPATVVLMDHQKACNTEQRKLSLICHNPYSNSSDHSLRSLKKFILVEASLKKLFVASFSHHHSPRLVPT